MKKHQKPTASSCHQRSPSALLVKICALISMLLFHPLLYAEQVQIVAAKDTSIYENVPSNANGSGLNLFMGRTKDQPGVPNSLRRALVFFDLGSIPSNAIIDSVSVGFVIDKLPADGTPFGGTAALHRLSSPWGEGATVGQGEGGNGAASQVGDATWTHAVWGSTAWGTAGGDFEASSSAAKTYNNFSDGPLLFDTSSELVQDVQYWLTNPSENFGWMLRGEEGAGPNPPELTARRLVSRESANASSPTITVDYHLPAPADILLLTEVVSGLNVPIGIVNAGDGSNRLFIIEQAGVIKIFDTETETLLATPFLDIIDRADSSANEQGLLGLAFHPDYVNNGRFFVYYTYDPAGSNPDRSRLARYEVSVGDANVADLTETVLMEFEQDSSNHNGGDMHFGPDGFLYMAIGDGGGSDNEYGHAQDIDSLKGKMLRIDVDAPASGSEKCGLVSNYSIPPGNAFPGSNDGCDEILHYGLRNPWRFSMDAQTGELMIGDVGQGLWEEVDYAAVGAAGINFGWGCREGAHDFNGGACISAYTDPVIEYSSANGTGNCSVTGGYVYRGGSLPLQGKYIYGDYCSDRIWIATLQGGTWSSEEWVGADLVLESIASFGQDEKCNVYVADRNAQKIYRIDGSQYFRTSGFEALNCQ